MGEVYRGTDTVLERPVAIKFLTDRASGRSVSERILSEARSASALSHPNVCTVYEVSESNGHPCIVMEYVEGQPLSTIIPPGVGLPVETTVSYGMQIADALAHAHDAGVVHRDLKSANILITPQQRVKVLDFGLAVQDAAEGVDDETSTVDEMQPGSDPGTPGTLRYMAPEVLRGERADRQSDIWALGAVLYEMAAGKRPFNGRTAHEISAAILTQSPDPLPPEVPSGLRAIIRTCLTKERARRYHSASEVKAALEALQLDPRPGPASISRRAAVLLGIGLLVAVIIALAMSAAALMRRNPVSTSSSAPVDTAPPPPAKLLAVLPQVIAGSTTANAALTETVVDDMILRIASVNLPKLKLIAFPTALRFQSDSGDPIAKAREELKADFVVTIEVSTEKQRLAFSAILADTADRSQMWGRPYEGTLDDIFAIESEVAAQIVDVLMPRLSPGKKLNEAERSKLADQPTVNFSAYKLYAEGRRVWYRPTSTPDPYNKSIAFYEKAIARDPKFAVAYLGKADTIGGMAWEGWIPPIKAYQAAADALQRVERLAPNLGQAHHTRAWLKLMEKDWAGAEREYLAAIEANPSLPMNRRFYALYLVGRGRISEALRVLRETLVWDQQGVGTNLALATTLYWSGELDEAIARLNELIDSGRSDPSTELIDSGRSDPSTAPAREILADVYESRGSLRAAITQRAQALRIIGRRREADDLERKYAAVGFRAAMTEFYRRQLSMVVGEDSKGVYISPVYFALLYIHRDEPDKAFGWLDRAVRENAPWLHLIRVDPAFQSIRSDPRFEPLVRRYETTGFPAPRTN
jgi:TolB-like protein/tRNA A-37 threonylcarbamoyl transferase component Bud32